MKLSEIKPMHGEGLYDCDGNLVGKWYGERGMLADCFIVKERVCHVVGTISMDWSDGSTVYEHDLSCGHTCSTRWPNPPAYCYRCGARVVDE